MAAAFYLRVRHQADAVLTPNGVSFSEVDAWFHMRLVDALVANFPHLLPVDPYAIWGGARVRTGPLFDLLVASTALVLGGGAPSPRLVDLVGAWMPVVLGLATLLPIFALGRRLFGRRAGQWAALVFAVLPGVVLERTALGFADHHALEVLCTALVLLGVARATEPAPAPGRAVLTGLALGGYLLAWTSGTFLLAILWAWLGLDVLRRLARGASTDPPCRVGVVAFAVALAVVLPFVRRVGDLDRTAVALGAGLAATILLGVAARASGSLPRVWRLPVALGVVACALAAGAVVRPDAVASALASVRRLTGGASEVGELQSLFADGWWAGPWAQLGSAGPIAVVGLGLTAAGAGRRASGRLLLLTFAAVAFAACALQVRFAIYLAIAVAPLAGLALARATAPGAWRAARVAGAAAVLLVPTGRQALAVARAPNPLSGAWWGALSWMRTHTPEPFGDADAYLHPPEPSEGDEIAYPPSAYSVMAWWDYGYWIERIARRIPVTNPTQHRRDEAAAFLLATTPEDAARILTPLRTRYVVVDAALATGDVWKLDAIVAAAGRDPGELYQRCWSAAADGTIVELPIYFPAYYESMAVRLALFAGEAVEPHDATWLVTTETRTRPDGSSYCALAAATRFPTLDAARAAMPATPGARIAGLTMTDTPVPLAKLAGFRRVYDSPERGPIPATRLTAPLVRIFAYAPP